MTEETADRTQHGGGAATLSRELGDRARIANSLNSLSGVAWMQGDTARARSLLEDSLATYRDWGSSSGIAAALGNLANLAREDGDLATPPIGAKDRESIAQFTERT
mgnify:CR=1 FL=1